MKYKRKREKDKERERERKKKEERERVRKRHIFFRRVIYAHIISMKALCCVVSYQLSPLHYNDMF